MASPRIDEQILDHASRRRSRELKHHCQACVPRTDTQARGTQSAIRKREHWVQQGESHSSVDANLPAVLPVAPHGFRQSPTALTRGGETMHIVGTIETGVHRLLGDAARFLSVASMASFDLDGWMMGGDSVPLREPGTHVHDDADEDDARLAGHAVRSELEGWMAQHRCIAATAEKWEWMHRHVSRAQERWVNERVRFETAWERRGVRQFTLFEAKYIRQVLLWAEWCIEGVQMLMLWSVSAFTPTMDMASRRVFCRSLARSLFLVCGEALHSG